MLDVIAVLRPPAPWEPHGTLTSLPGAMQALLSRWPGRQSDFFVTSGPAEQAIRSGGFQAPGLVSGDGAPPERLTPGTLDALQAALDSLSDQPARRHLQIVGPVEWTGTLQVRNARRLTLDFSAAEIAGPQADAPLIVVTGSEKVTLRGLRAAGRRATAIEISASQDVALTGSAVMGTVLLSGGCRRVLIDASALVAIGGPAIRIQGDAAQVIVARSQFGGVSASPFIEIGAASGAHPMDIRILENRFGPSETGAIRAEAVCGLWAERNDMAAGTASVFATGGGAVGVMLADNRIQGASGSKAPLVALADTALACIFRNTFEPQGQESLVLSGRFGGMVIGGNTAIIQDWPASQAQDAAIRLSPSGAGAFLSTTVMTNTIRGPFGSGIAIDAALPRLFLFDNHIFGTTRWSIESAVRQPGVTSINNWSPVVSLKVPLSEGANNPAPVIRPIGLRKLLARLRGR